jgi:hypothetical protein
VNAFDAWGESEDDGGGCGCESERECKPHHLLLLSDFRPLLHNLHPIQGCRDCRFRALAPHLHHNHHDLLVWAPRAPPALPPHTLLVLSSDHGYGPAIATKKRSIAIATKKRSIVNGAEAPRRVVLSGLVAADFAMHMEEGDLAAWETTLSAAKRQLGKREFCEPLEDCPLEAWT